MKATLPAVTIGPPSAGVPTGSGMPKGALSRLVPFLCIQTFFMLRRSSAVT